MGSTVLPLLFCCCSTCMNLYLSLRAFGAKVMNMKQLMKALPGMFEHSDKNVRAEV